MSARDALLVLGVVAAVVAAVAGGTAGGGAGTSSGASGGAVTAGSTVAARVVRVVDGDTVHVRRVDDGREETVRYIGIDTPESVKPDTPVQCYAKAASARNEQLVDGRPVRLVVGAEPRDRYGRLLAYVYLAGAGTSVNETLLAEGFARTLTIPPNDRYASLFASVAADARAHDRGLWGRC